MTVPPVGPRVRLVRRGRPVEMRGAILDAASVGALAPMVAAVVDILHSTDGPLTIDLSAKPGVILLELRANVTALTLAGATDGQMVVLIVIQGPIGGLTWPAPADAKMAGGPVSVGAVTPGHRDIYTLAFDGALWNETGRTLDAF